MATGWGRVGEALAGLSPGAREDRTEKYLGNMIARGINGEKLKLEQMKVAARKSGLGDSLIAAGYTPEEAALVVENARGESGADYAATVRGLGDSLQQGFRKKAVDYASGGDMNAANAQLMGVANGPQQLSTITAGQMFNPKATPGLGNKVIVTPVGQAGINATNARATQSNASAGASNARAQATRDKMQNPEKYRATGKANPVRSDLPPVEGAKKAKDGYWYVQKGSAWYRVDN